MGKSNEKEEFWRLVVEEYHTSGLTVRAFCQREGVSEPSFYAWRKRLLSRDKARTRELAKGLIPVDIIDSLDGCASSSDSQNQASGVSNDQRWASIEVLTPCGFTVRANQAIEPCRLRGLLVVIIGLDREAAQC